MKTLLCVRPGEVYVDEDMEIWSSVSVSYGHLQEETCQYCYEDIGDVEEAWQNDKDDSYIHATCVKEVLPCEMFSAYEAHSTMSAIMERFLIVFQAAEREFTKHMLEKKDSWLQLPADNLFSMVHKVAAKLMLAESIDDSYEELIDLLLCSAMLAQRYLIDSQRDDDDIPF